MPVRLCGLPVSILPAQSVYHDPMSRTRPRLAVKGNPVGFSACLHFDTFVHLSSERSFPPRQGGFHDSRPSFGYPLAWCFTEEHGRVFSMSLGHFPAAWESPDYLRHVAGGLGWALEA